MSSQSVPGNNHQTSLVCLLLSRLGLKGTWNPLSADILKFELQGWIALSSYQTLSQLWTSSMVMTALIQSPAGELLPRSHEITVCEVGNPKLQSWTPPSLHPANPRPPKKCPADPLRVFMSQLCLGATARSHFNSRTPLSGRPARCALAVCVCALSVFTHMPACLPACICYCCVVCGVCIFAIYEKALKGKVWMGEVEKKEKRRCLHEWKGSRKNSGTEQQSQKEERRGGGERDMK